MANTNLNDHILLSRLDFNIYGDILRRKTKYSARKLTNRHVNCLIVKKKWVKLNYFVSFILLKSGLVSIARG